MKRSWDSLAHVYDWQLRLEREAVRVAVELAAVSGGDRVLDIGTGTGAILRELARRGLQPASVLGVDRSAAMLRRVPPLPPDWRLQQASASRLPLADASIDVAFAGYLLHLLSERRRLAALREIRRVLTTQGRLVVVTPALPVHALRRQAYRALLTALDHLAPGVSKTLRPIDLDRQLTSAGLEIDADLSAGHGYPSRCLRARPMSHS